MTRKQAMTNACLRGDLRQMDGKGQMDGKAERLLHQIEAIDEHV